MSRKKTAFLGLDVGQINTRASFFNIQDHCYRLMGSAWAQTSLGMHLASGAGEAMRALQRSTGHTLLEPGKGLITPLVHADRGVDQLALVVSLGAPIKTTLLGLTEGGSLAAGRALIDSLPLNLVSAYGMGDLADPSAVVRALVHQRPEIVVFTGGEDGGVETPLQQWTETLRLVLRLLPENQKPIVVYAGNINLQSHISRRLEPMTRLYQLPNLIPRHGMLDLTPAQEKMNQLILSLWEEKLDGLRDLSQLSRGLKSTTAFAENRMVRFLSRWNAQRTGSFHGKGVLSISLGGGSTHVSAGIGDKVGTIIQPDWQDIIELQKTALISLVRQWVGRQVPPSRVQEVLTSFAVHPGLLPETAEESAILQAYARVSLWVALEKFNQHYPWLGFDVNRGLEVLFEPIIVSGSVISQANTPGQAMLMLLDGVQPRGITTIVLDQHHILSLLGLLGERDPVLPIQVLNSDALINLGTVIAPVNPHVVVGSILTVHVSTDSGKNYSVDVAQGTLRRLVIPAGVTAVLELEPSPNTDLGLGGKGRAGKLKVTGGLLGVIIDARGRPVCLPANDEERIENLTQWAGVLGGYVGSE